MTRVTEAPGSNARSPEIAAAVTPPGARRAPRRPGPHGAPGSAVGARTEEPSFQQGRLRPGGCLVALEAEGMQALSPPAEQQGAPQKQNPTCLRVVLCLWKRSEQGPGTQPPGVLCGWALTLGPSQAEERLGCGGVGGRVTAILLGEQSSGRRQGSPAVPALSQYPSLGRVNTEPPGLAAQAACSAGPVGRAEPGLQLLQRTGAVEPARPRSGWDARPACTGGLYAIGLPERHPGWESVAPREGVEQGSVLGPLCRASGGPGGRHFLPASTSPCRAWAAHQSLHSALCAQTSCLELWGHHQSLEGCLCPPGLQGTWYRKGWGLGRVRGPARLGRTTGCGQLWLGQGCGGAGGA